MYVYTKRWCVLSLVFAHFFVCFPFSKRIGQAQSGNFFAGSGCVDYRVDEVDYRVDEDKTKTFGLDFKTPFRPHMTGWVVPAEGLFSYIHSRVTISSSLSLFEGGIFPHSPYSTLPRGVDGFFFAFLVPGTLTLLSAGNGMSFLRWTSLEPQHSFIWSHSWCSKFEIYPWVGCFLAVIDWSLMDYPSYGYNPFLLSFPPQFHFIVWEIGSGMLPRSSLIV